MCLTLRAIGRQLFCIAFPIWLAEMLTMSWGVLDTAMLATVSGGDLAALTLGGSFYMALHVAGLGVLQALAPIASHLYGERRWREIGSMARQALWVALALTALGTAILISPWYLDMATLEPAVRGKAEAYLHVIAFGLLGNFVLRVISALTQAIGRPQVVTVWMLVGLGLKIPLNYVFVFGAFGVPVMGVAGCAVASVIAHTTICMGALLYLWWAPAYSHFELFRFEWPKWGALAELLRLGLPFGLGYWLEVGVFSALAVAMSRLGTDALAASQIVDNFVNLLFTVPLAISLAVAVQIGHLVGEGRNADAVRAGRFALGIAALLALLFAGTAWLAPGLVLHVYRPVPALTPIIAGLFGLLVFYHLADALQSVASFLNRAYKNAWCPAIVYATCMWGVALGLGKVLAYGWHWKGRLLLPPLVPGLSGFYVGQAVGLGLAGLAMWAYWRMVIVGRFREFTGIDGGRWR